MKKILLLISVLMVGCTSVRIPTTENRAKRKLNKAILTQNAIVNAYPSLTKLRATDKVFVTKEIKKDTVFFTDTINLGQIKDSIIYFDRIIYKEIKDSAVLKKRNMFLDKWITKIDTFNYLDSSLSATIRIQNNRILSINYFIKSKKDTISVNELTISGTSENKINYIWITGIGIAIIILKLILHDYERRRRID